MVRTARVLILVAVVAVGCGANSPADPAGTMTLRGTVVGSAGAPGADVTALARRSLAAEDVQTARLSELDTLGFACIDERPPEACEHDRASSHADDAGSFVLELGATGAVDAGPAIIAAPEAVVVVVHASAGPDQLSGPAVSRDVLAADEGADLGALELWDPTIEITPSPSGDAAVRWEPAPPGAVTQYEVLVEGSDGDLVWQESTKKTELTLLKQHLDGTKGAVSVVAFGADPPARFRSARVPYRADSGPVMLAATEDVGWPEPRTVPEELLLVAIVALMLASVMLVTATAGRHRHQMARVSGRSRARG